MFLFRFQPDFLFIIFLDPYIAGTTSTSSPDITLPPLNTAGKFQTELYEISGSDLDCISMTSSYAWIPSLFKISPDGTDVRIDSYINGLGNREEYPRLFRVIEKIFLLALPHFEKTMKQSVVYTPSISPSGMPSFILCVV